MDMGVQVGDGFLYTLLSADDQKVVASDLEDSSCVMRKLMGEYQKWRQ
jgi:hypothetical protein